MLSHFSALFGLSSAGCVNLASDLRCTSCPIVLMILNHTFNISYVLEGMSLWTCYGEAVKGVDLQDTSSSAITARMSTLCLLVDAKWIAQKETQPRSSLLPYSQLLLPFSAYFCQSVPAVTLCPQVNIEALPPPSPQKGSTSRHSSKHTFFLIHPHNLAN